MNNENNNILGENIALLRKRKKLSVSDLAKKLEVSTATVSQWQTGKTKPRMNKLEELATILEVDISTLMHGVNTSMNGATSNNYMKEFQGFKNILDPSNEMTRKAQGLIHTILDTQLEAQSIIDTFSRLTHEQRKIVIEGLIPRMTNKDIKILLHELANKLSDK